MIKASACLVYNLYGEVLCVWHKKFQGWVLPSGKQEEGEAAGSTAIRELREETGLKAGKAYEVYRAVSLGETDVDVSVFRMVLDDYSTEIQTEDESTYTWMPLRRLAEVSPFGGFYADMLRKGPIGLG